MSADTFTTTVDAAAAHAARFAVEDDARPDPAEVHHDMPPLGQRPDSLPDPYVCVDPWCPSAVQGRHLHGTRPDGVRV